MQTSRPKVVDFQISACSKEVAKAILTVRDIVIGSVGVVAVLPPTFHVSSTVNQMVPPRRDLPGKSGPPEQGADLRDHSI